MRTRGPQVREVALARRMKHSKAGPCKCLDRSVVDRTGALGAAEDEHARLLRSDPEALPRGIAVGRCRRDWPAGDPISGSVPPFEGERQENPACKWSEQPVG